MKKKGVLDGQWTQDTFDSECSCGGKTRYSRRKGIKLLPNGHKCTYLERQKDVMRTIRAEESAGINVTPSEARRRIDEALRD